MDYGPKVRQILKYETKFTFKKRLGDMHVFVRAEPPNLDRLIYVPDEIRSAELANDFLRKAGAVFRFWPP